MDPRGVISHQASPFILAGLRPGTGSKSVQTHGCLGWRKRLRGFRRGKDFMPCDVEWVPWFRLPNILVGRNVYSQPPGKACGSP